jgi:hypothetical protein
MTADPQLWIFMKQKGGVGATDFCAKMVALADMSGARCLVLDADNALRSYKFRHGPHAAVSVPPADLPDPNVFLDSLKDHADIVCLDLPGAFFTRTDKETKWLGHVIDGRSACAMERTFFYIAASNAPGSTENAIQLHETLELTGRHILVLNDSSGTGIFDPVPPPPTMGVLRVGHVPPGIVAAVQQIPRPLADFIRFPERHYLCASSLMAGHLLKIARSPVLKGMLPRGTAQKIARYGTDDPGDLEYVVWTAAEAHDDVLRPNASLSRSHTALLNGSLIRVIPAALAYRRAYRRYNAALRASERHEAR